VTVKRLLVILLAAALLVAGVAGCSGDRDKGVHSKHDRPKAED
jgi:hypothetical protein